MVARSANSAPPGHLAALLHVHLYYTMLHSTSYNNLTTLHVTAYCNLTSLQITAYNNLTKCSASKGVRTVVLFNISLKQGTTLQDTVIQTPCKYNPKALSTWLRKIQETAVILKYSS